jgi:hypothetical protein
MKGIVVQIITNDRAIPMQIDIKKEGELTVAIFKDGHKETIPHGVVAIIMTWNPLEKNIPTYFKAGNNWLGVSENAFTKSEGFTASEVAAYTDSAIIVRGILKFWQDQQNQSSPIVMIIAVIVIIAIAYFLLSGSGIQIPFISDMAKIAPKPM